ncbi:Asp-tRNA(Asn)/Glu-tRNA(Gln) amidotransferase subunit GatC [Helicobacter sp. 13S00477-4]|uniref:Asp-tRNA(Asn)/Glu-tRNA(Gln) amidotransferase subunit GatC n=1 Tax=Helicobacter sp. 13S00477-4 TaxID=1905759 RepID=UPI000BA55700|nr:Asp-tRNA(Asn)/Glu-tRNA(Gln) amidotransferase subunit GatC [Helicobacter sp. 13S00477-4]PAF52239.1 asparaginyl/glutamyl-tRNA amidotransferase subunit C [Helicobacter sp. 13S00477-4]
MNIDDDVLNKLEKLGMIQIDEDKKESLKIDLGDILGFVANISDLDFDNVDEDYPIATPLREDIKQIDTSISSNILKNAPCSKEGYFIVPKIIE